MEISEKKLLMKSVALGAAYGASPSTLNKFMSKLQCWICTPREVELEDDEKTLCYGCLQVFSEIKMGDLCE